MLLRQTVRPQAKGVIVALTDKEAHDAIDFMLGENKLGDAGARIVIEEFLTGEEASFIVMVDGEHVVPMASSQDHKRLLDDDKGPNTGGMGAYSPAPVVTQEIHDKTMEEIILPTVRGMAKDGIRYTGFLYAGLMIDKDKEGKPTVKTLNSIAVSATLRLSRLCPASRAILQSSSKPASTASLMKLKLSGILDLP